MALIAAISGQCLIDSASADPPASHSPPQNSPLNPSETSAQKALHDPAHPALKFNKQDFVPIPDMVEMPIELPPALPKPSSPSVPLKVTIPNINNAQTRPATPVKRVPAQNVAGTTPLPAPPTPAPSPAATLSASVPAPPSKPPPEMPDQKTAVLPASERSRSTPVLLWSKADTTSLPPPQTEGQAKAPEQDAPTRAREARASVPTRELRAHTRESARAPAPALTQPNTITVSRGMAKPAPVAPVRVYPIADLTPQETLDRAKAAQLAAQQLAEEKARLASDIAAEATQPHIDLPPEQKTAPAAKAKPLLSATIPDEPYITDENGKPLVYRSPGIMLRSHEMTEADSKNNELSSLTPSAGNPATDQPLIPMPDKPLPPETPLTTATAPTPPAAPAPAPSPAPAPAPTPVAAATPTAPVATPAATDPDAAVTPPPAVAAATPEVKQPETKPPESTTTVAAAPNDTATPTAISEDPAQAQAAKMAREQAIEARRAAQEETQKLAESEAVKAVAKELEMQKKVQAIEMLAKAGNKAADKSTEKPAEKPADKTTAEKAGDKEKSPAITAQIKSKTTEKKTTKLTQSASEKPKKPTLKAGKQQAETQQPDSTHANWPKLAETETPPEQKPTNTLLQTAPGPIVLPMPQSSPTAENITPTTKNPAPLLATPAIRPGAEPTVAKVLPPAPGLPSNVPNNAVQSWHGNNGSAASAIAGDPAPSNEAVPDPADTVVADAKEPLEPLPPPAPQANEPQAPAPKKQNLAVNDPTEPPRELSSESKHILNTLPDALETSKKSHAATDELALLRGKAAQEENTAIEAKATAVTHDAMGIKIEVKTPRINVDYELEKAYNALTSGNTDMATSIYRNVLENDANNKNALFGLATIYHRAGLLEKARPLYAQLLTLDPGNRDGLNNFLVLLSDEAPEDALSHLETLRQANPGFSPIPAQMAVIYQKLGNNDDAIKMMTNAISLAPENLAYRYNFAIMLDKQKKYDEAATLYRQILQAYQRGDKIPGNIQQIQQRLTFISSNRN